jgi:hypothetical protein
MLGQELAAIFCANCELDHIHGRINGAMSRQPDGASRFQCPAVGKVAWRYTALAALFFLGVYLFLTDPARAPAGESAVGLPEAIAIAPRFGHLLDFPEHPHKGRTQADDDPQKQQRQARDCEHVNISEIDASCVPASGVKKRPRRENTPRPLESSWLSRSQF